MSFVESNNALPNTSPTLHVGFDLVTDRDGKGMVVCRFSGNFERQNPTNAATRRVDVTYAAPIVAPSASVGEVVAKVVDAFLAEVRSEYLKNATAMRRMADQLDKETNRVERAQRVQAPAPEIPEPPAAAPKTPTAEKPNQDPYPGVKLDTDGYVRSIGAIKFLPPLRCRGFQADAHHDLVATDGPMLLLHAAPRVLPWLDETMMDAERICAGVDSRAVYAVTVEDTIDVEGFSRLTGSTFQSIHMPVKWNGATLLPKDADLAEFFEQLLSPLPEEIQPPRVVFLSAAEETDPRSTVIAACLLSAANKQATWEVIKGHLALYDIVLAEADEAVVKAFVLQQNLKHAGV